MALGAVLQFRLVVNLREFFLHIPFMPQSAKDAMLEAVSRGGMSSMVLEDTPAFLQDLIAQVMREQFVGAINTAMAVAMFVAVAGAAVALFIDYRPVKKASSVR